jgi:hypothetical protein
VGAVAGVGGTAVAVASTCTGFVASTGLPVGSGVILAGSCSVASAFMAVAVAAATAPMFVPATVGLAPVVGVAFGFFEEDMVQAPRMSARTTIHVRRVNFFIINSFLVRKISSVCVDKSVS